MKEKLSDLMNSKWGNIKLRPFEQVTRYVLILRMEQPNIYNYLEKIGNVHFNIDEKELLLYVNAAIWDVIKYLYGSVEQISTSILEEKNQINIDNMNKIRNNTQTELFDFIDHLKHYYPRSPLFSYIVKSLVSYLNRQNLIRQEKESLMLITLKTVIDSFEKFMIKK